MSNAAQSVAILTLVASAGLVSIGAFAFQYRDQPGARGFSITMIAASAWSVVLALNVWPTPFFEAHISMTLRNGLILLMLLGWLMFVLEYVNRGRITVSPHVAAAVLVIPILTILLTVTNPLHHLAIGPETPASVGGGSEIDWGPWHLVFMAYAFTISFVPAGILFRDLRSAHGIHREQLLLLLGGWAVAFVGANDYLVTGAIEGIPNYIRLSPFAFLITAGFWSLALFRHQLFGLVPVSRRTVVETIPDPVIAVDETGHVVDVNPAARDIFGIEADVTGTNLFDFEDEFPTIVDAYRNESTAEELPIEMDDGTVGYFSVTVERIRNGKAGSIVVLRTVTELKERERELERKNQRLDRFTAFVSHDLRNPVQVAQMYLEQARETGDEAAFEEVKWSHERIEEMIAAIRALTRIDADDLNHAPVDLETVAITAWDQVYDSDGSLTIDQTTSFEADETYLSHLFGNLFRNAVDHAGQDASVRVGVLDDGFYVEDDGPGIPPEERSEVFDHGFSTSESGTGYGLSIVETVADVHGWTVSITDGTDGGARFEIRSVKLFE